MKSVLEYALSLRRETIWHGDHDENDRQVILRAGHLSMVYENGNLRYISLGNREIIRMIYSALRDKEWLTIKPEISDEIFDIQHDSFSIKYNCLYKSGEINFSATYTIEGNADNSLTFTLEGEALHSFDKNRLGFCLLHPIDGFAGENCIIRHSNDELESLKFPQLISPNQPFTDIRSMKWKIYDLDCTVDLHGDIFETEDQRNWTDSSYKTYCTPLIRPFPSRVHKGEKIYQKIEFKAEGDYIPFKDESSVIGITVNPEKIFDLPKIGIGRTTRPEPLTEREIQILKPLRFDHYRVDLHLFSNDWTTIADMAAAEASRLGYPLEIALFFDDNALQQSSEFVRWLSVTLNEVAVIILFDKSEPSTPDLLSDIITPMLNEALPGAIIGCGTNANFVQLNRNRPVSDMPDLLCYSIHPQEHATDNSTLTENLGAQEYTVETAKQFAKGKGIWISPVNIQRRFNPNIENYEQPLSDTCFPPQVDNRLMSLFGAGWTTGSLKYLCEANIKGLTYFETVGERGIIQGDLPSRWTNKFQSINGMIFPVYFVLQYILKLKSYKVIGSESSHPLSVDILSLTNGKQLKVILANLTPFQQTVTIAGSSGELVIKQLDDENYREAVSDNNWSENAAQTKVNSNEHLFLKPFSVSFIDGWLE